MTTPIASPIVDACAGCLRRTALVAALSGRIEHEWRLKRGRPQLLALTDERLLAWADDDAVRAIYDGFVADVAIDRLAAAGLGAVCRHAAGYPPGLLDLPDPPAVLHFRGDLTAAGGGPANVAPGDAASRPLLLGDGTPAGAGQRLVASGGDSPLAQGVAIVGARRASAAGLDVARSLARGLAASGVPVVSGMALGIDGAAHAGALDAGGTTVAVLATGADRPYPARHGTLHGRIAATGVVVSELPPGTEPRRWAFPARNRLIAALAGVTVVVEGGDRSGSLITADFAADIGRVVGAVPGPVSSSLSAGPNLLIKVGAELVRGAADVLDLLAALPGLDRPASAAAPRRGVPEPVIMGRPDLTASEPPAVVPAPADLDPRTRAVLARIEAGEDSLAALVRSADDAFAISADLGELEVRRLIRRLPDGRYLRALL